MIVNFEMLEVLLKNLTIVLYFICGVISLLGSIKKEKDKKSLFIYGIANISASILFYLM